ncbi:MAG: hypothetical protein JWR75_1333 [Devosia sp.]|nr:hypothetical protein [Devosia sp.]
MTMAYTRLVAPSDAPDNAVLVYFKIRKGKAEGTVIWPMMTEPSIDIEPALAIIKAERVKRRLGCPEVVVYLEPDVIWDSHWATLVAPMAKAPLLEVVIG